MGKSAKAEPDCGDPAVSIVYCVRLFGQVQGIGYRPELARLASTLSLRGSVANTATGIEVRISGDESAVESFLECCESLCPPEGRVVGKQVERIVALLPNEFTILTSAETGPLNTHVPLDRVTCRDCRLETQTSSDPRTGYVLISCSRCGPRYSILDVMPYERHLTSMKRFRLCANCQHEYSNPLDRRFHAQTTCCAKCGPNCSGLEFALQQLRAGQVIAIQGVGGYQLLCRLDNRFGIEQLRSIKQRNAKPFAVMVRDVEQASHLVRLCEDSIRALESNAGPIVVAPLNGFPTFPADAVNPGLQTLGIMLPTSALHDRMVDAAGPLIVTSANLEGDPIVYRDWDKTYWSNQGISAAVTHERAILRPVDDSVVRVIAGQVTAIRAARGLAPMALDFGYLNLRQPILAVGGSQKVSVALSNGRQSILGPHIGDLDSSDARQRFEEQVHHLLQLYGCEPSLVVHDAHPDYYTTRWAKHFARERGIPTCPVQHHVAHVASSLIEPRWIECKVTSLAWDGTGLGDDGTIWGGEGFIFENEKYTRVCRLRRFLLPGGEAAIKQPWRIASGLLHLIKRSDSKFDFQLEQASSTIRLFGSTHYSFVTSSMGRLFDAVAVLIMGATLPHGDVAYEGQYAALLEAHTDLRETEAYPLPVRAIPTWGVPVDVFGNASPALDLPSAKPPFPAFPSWSETDQNLNGLSMEWNWEPMVRAIITDHSNHVPSPRMAMRFHRALANAVSQFVSLTNHSSLSLSGGVFQNQILVELVAQDLKDRNIKLALPGMIPVNDGGLAAGQLLVAAQRLASGSLRVDSKTDSRS